MEKLSDILSNATGEDLSRAWDDTEAAEDNVPLPRGEYIARIISGGLFTAAKKGTPGYKLAFKVLEGDHAGRRFWHDIYLTAPALPMAKRDLEKLGIYDLEQLEQPIPFGFRCSVKLTLRRDDDGFEYNRVQFFEVVGVDKPERDVFAPDDTITDIEEVVEPRQESGENLDLFTDEYF